MYLGSRCKLVWYFLKNGGQAVCEVTERKFEYELEVPCTYKIYGNRDVGDETAGPLV